MHILYRYMHILYRKPAYFLLLLLSSIFGHLSAQTTLPLVDTVRLVSEKLNLLDNRVLLPQLTNDTNGIMSKPVYNKYIDGKFTFLAFQRSTLPSGNSAALDLLDNATKINLAISKKFSGKADSGGILLATAGAKAQIGNGVSQLFSGNTATTGTTLFANFAFLPVSFHTVTVTDDIINGVEQRSPLSAPFKALQKKLAGYRNKFRRDVIDTYLEKYQGLICRLQQIGLLICDCTDTACCRRNEELLREKAFIEQELAAAGIPENSTDDIVKSLANKYQDGYYSLLTDKPVWQWFKMHWWNWGITYSRQSYITYDGTQFLGKRFGEKDFDTWGLNITDNWFEEKAQEAGFVRAWYASLSASANLINNYSLLKAQNIVNTIVKSSAGDTNYVIQNTKQALDVTNKGYTTAWQYSFGGNFSAMFFDKKFLGVDLSFQTQVSNISAPVFNSKAGLIFVVPNNYNDPTDKKSPTKISFELFLQFADMSDTQGTGKSVWQNRVLGISTNIPFSKIFIQ